MIVWQKENSVMVQQAAKMSADELKGKYVIGEMVVRDDKLEYTKSYAALKARAMAKGKGGSDK